MIKRLYIFANMGHLYQLPKSGGQSSARRVIKGLEMSQIEIIPIRRHRNEWEGRFAHAFEVFLFAFVDTVKILLKLFRGKRKDSAFMNLSYTGSLVTYEIILSVIANILGFRSILYVKGGKCIESYEKGSFVYRKLFQIDMKLQDLVLCEGFDDLALIKSLSNTITCYFPNYIFEKDIPHKFIKRETNTINLIYFGRIAPQKNIDVIIDAFDILSGTELDVNLTLIGGVGPNHAYLEMIKNKIELSPNKNKIVWYGQKSQDEIIESLRYKHFFLFPTNTPAEGHSNALNEAMSQGVVPIVSNFHFNRSIVGDERMVVDSYKPEEYANKIIEILHAGNYDVLSEMVWRRVIEKFSYNQVNNRIVDCLNQI